MLSMFRSGFSRLRGESAGASVRAGSAGPVTEAQAQAQARDNKSTVSGACFNFINSIVGAGIIGIPYAIYQSGFFLGLIAMVVVAALIHRSVIMIIECGIMAKQYNFEALCRHCMGNTGYKVCCVCMIMFAYGAQIAYLVIIGDTIPSVAQIYSPGSIWTDRTFVICFMAVFVILPITLLRDMSSLSRTSLLSVIAVITLVLIAAIKAPEVKKEEDIGNPELSFANKSVFAGIGTMSFAFVCQHSSFVVFCSLKKPTLKNWKKVTNLSVFMAFVLCMTLGLSGYLNFSTFTESDLLTNFPESDQAAAAARVLMALTMVFTYPMECYVSRHSIVSLVHDIYNTDTTDKDKSPGSESSAERSDRKDDASRALRSSTVDSVGNEVELVNLDRLDRVNAALGLSVSGAGANIANTHGSRIGMLNGDRTFAMKISSPPQSSSPTISPSKMSIGHNRSSPLGSPSRRASKRGSMSSAGKYTSLKDDTYPTTYDGEDGRDAYHYDKYDTLESGANVDMPDRQIHDRNDNSPGKASVSGSSVYEDFEVDSFVSSHGMGIKDVPSSSTANGSTGQGRTMNGVGAQIGAGINKLGSSSDSYSTQGFDSSSSSSSNSSKKRRRSRTDNIDMSKSQGLSRTISRKDSFLSKSLSQSHASVRSLFGMSGNGKTNGVGDQTHHLDASKNATSNPLHAVAMGGDVIDGSSADTLGNSIVYMESADDGIDLAETEEIPTTLCQHVTLTVLLWGSTLLIAVVFGDLGVVLALTGAVAGSMLGYILPALIYFMSYRTQWDEAYRAPWWDTDGGRYVRANQLSSDSAHNSSHRMIDGKSSLGKQTYEDDEEERKSDARSDECEEIVFGGSEPEYHLRTQSYDLQDVNLDDEEITVNLNDQMVRNAVPLPSKSEKRSYAFAPAYRKQIQDGDEFSKAENGYGHGADAVRVGQNGQVNSADIVAGTGAGADYGNGVAAGTPTAGPSGTRGVLRRKYVLMKPFLVPGFMLFFGVISMVVGVVTVLTGSA